MIIIIGWFVVGWVSVSLFHIMKNIVEGRVWKYTLVVDIFMILILGLLGPVATLIVLVATVQWINWDKIDWNKRVF